MKFKVQVKTVHTEVGYIDLEANSQKEAESIVRKAIRNDEPWIEPDIDFGRDTDKRFVVPE